jgi:hypothetical protein
MMLPVTRRKLVDQYSEARFPLLIFRGFPGRKELIELSSYLTDVWILLTAFVPDQAIAEFRIRSSASDTR